MSIEKCHIINLPKITDSRGSLTFIENSRHIPFDIKRVYYLYDIPIDKVRGGHAHKELHQLIIAMSGSFNVILDDGTGRKIFNLNQPYNGLYVCPMIWRDLEDFSQGAVSVILASALYDEGDYYRNYDEFLRAVRKSR